jgi:hypothetical protein
MDRRTCVPIRLLDLPLFLDKYSLSESFPLTPAAVAGRATEGAGERAKVIDRESTPELAVSRRSSPLPFCSLITLDAPSLSPLPPDATEPPSKNRHQQLTSTTRFHFTQKTSNPEIEMMTLIKPPTNLLLRLRRDSSARARIACS